MRTHFAFGKTGLTLDLPEGFHYKVLEARSASPCPTSPARSRRLWMPDRRAAPAVLAEGKKTAVDFRLRYHPAGAEQARPSPLLKRSHAAGIARENVTILIATGSTGSRPRRAR